MVLRSNITGNDYNEDHCVYILNTVQAALYLKHNVHLYDIRVNSDNKMVFIFDGRSSRDAYQKWMRHELT